jgi:hypothetical protein
MELPTVAVVVRASDGERQVFKPYRTHYKTRNFKLDIMDIEFFESREDENSVFGAGTGKVICLG